jgi:hypothetical protein
MAPRYTVATKKAPNPIDKHVSTAGVAYDASGLGSCDRRHKLLFEYPIIFWMPHD